MSRTQRAKGRARVHPHLISSSRSVFATICVYVHRSLPSSLIVLTIVPGTADPRYAHTSWPRTIGQCGTALFTTSHYTRIYSLCILIYSALLEVARTARIQKIRSPENTAFLLSLLLILSPHHAINLSRLSQLIANLTSSDLPYRSGSNLIG